MFRIPMLWIDDFYEALTQNDTPPTLYELMNSYVNYGKEIQVKIENLPEAFRSYLFDFPYPLDDKYKAEFEKIFLTHYMFRRIGYETYLAFKLHLKVKLFEIMPKYNKMFEGFSLVDFLGNQEIHTRTENEIGSSNSNNTNDNRFSNLPQNEITDVQNGTYMTDYTLNSGNATTQANRNTDENINITKIDTIDEYEKFIKFSNNIYTEIFKECDSLFFGLL